MVHDDEIAEAHPRLILRRKEAVDHRKPVALLVGQAGTNQSARHAVDRRFAIFDHKGVDGSLFHHVGKVDFVHSRHSAVWMPRGKILPQQLVLFIG